MVILSSFPFEKRICSIFFFFFLSGILYQEHVNSNHSARRDLSRREAAGSGKRDTGKIAKKSGMTILIFSSVLSQ